MNKIHVLKHFHTQTKQTGSNRIQDEKFKKNTIVHIDERNNQP
jgi:hypothetical protein